MPVDAHLHAEVDAVKIVVVLMALVAFLGFVAGLSLFLAALIVGPPPSPSDDSHDYLNDENEQATQRPDQ